METDVHSDIEEPGSPSLPPTYMDIRVEQLRQTLKRDNIDLDAPCTGSEENDCWLLPNLTPWNKILHLASMELKEYEPGKLALNALDLNICGCFDEGFLLDASYITYWLVKEHRCVQFFRPHPLMVARSGCVIKEALVSNAGIRHFEFRGDKKWQHKEAYFAEGVSALTNIESLRLCTVNLRHRSAALIAKMLENSKNVKAVTFSANSLSLHSSETLLRALRKSTTLTELAFDNNSVGRKGIKYLSQLVAKSQSLKKLSLKWSVKAEQGGIESLAHALKINSTLEKIDLYGCNGCTTGIAGALEVNAALKVATLTRCDIGDSDAARLARMLEKNGTLQELDVAHNNIGDTGAEALASGLCMNTTLEKLCLAENNISSRGARQLFAALATNRSLRMLDLDATFLPQDEHYILNSILRHAQAFGRVRMEWEDMDLPELAAAVSTDSKFEELHLTCTDELSENNLHVLFLALGTSTSVKKLTLRGGHDEVPVMKYLAEVIKTNKNIKYLNLDYQIQDYTDIKDLIEALKHNRSIVYCDIYFCLYDAKIAKALAALVSENATIASLVIHFYPASGKPLDVLSKALCKNHAMTRLKLGSEKPPNRITFRIGEALRRNLSVLYKAAHFVMMPSKDKDTVQAFERHAQSENLLQHLVHLTKKEEQEVKELIRAAKGYIAVNYFMIVGVVKENVECHPVSPYRTQIDQLNEECWRRVLLYLKVCDIVAV